MRATSSEESLTTRIRTAPVMSEFFGTRQYSAGTRPRCDFRSQSRTFCPRTPVVESSNLGVNGAQDRDGERGDAVDDELDADDRGHESHDLVDDALAGDADSRNDRRGGEKNQKRQNDVDRDRGAERE